MRLTGALPSARSDRTQFGAGADGQSASLVNAALIRRMESCCLQAKLLRDWRVKTSQTIACVYGNLSIMQT